MQKVALIILDGFGINKKLPKENAITLAKTPLFAKLFKSPYATLQASGKSVGIPAGQIGNSEIGHLTIGSGRIIKQDIILIDEMLDKGSFAKLETFQAGLAHCKKNKSNLHLLQIFGPGGVHGYDGHLKKILKLIPKDIPVYLHLFGDGRDLPPQSAYELMVEFEKFLDTYSHVKIASFVGRYYAMDRDNNRGRIQKAYEEIMFGQSQTSDTPSEYIRKSYENGVTDEFILPVSFTDSEVIEDNDTVLHLNFRSDRARQLSQALMVSMHPELKKDIATRNANFFTKKLRNIYFVSMTKYYPQYDGPLLIKEKNIVHTLGETLAEHECRQLHLAETEKFAHVTKFFNGGLQIVYDGEKDILVPSHKVKTFDLDPGMSAQEIYEQFAEHAQGFDFVVMNFANGDMLGHTGFLQATIQSLETLDEVVSKTLAFCKKNNFDIILTADHGNCEEMGTLGHPKTAHTTNPVPCRYIKDGEVQKIKAAGGLYDIAPTILKIMNIKIPKEMTGKALIS